jgi:pimeloyl-ACP methyl ester carboxylesterase
MGGVVAITAAGLIGNRLRHLVVAEPNLRPGGGLASRGIAAMSEADFLAHGHAELVRNARAEGYGAWAESVAISAPCAMHRVAVSLVAGSDPTWRAQLCALEMPCTMIFGEASLPNDDAETLPRDGVPVMIVPTAGHGMGLENPSGLAVAIAGAVAARSANALQ